VTDTTELARLHRDLAAERRHLRGAALMIAYSTALVVLGLSMASQLMLGIMIASMGVCGVLGGSGWALWHGARAAKHTRQIRALTQLPGARVIQR